MLYYLDRIADLGTKCAAIGLAGIMVVMIVLTLNLTLRGILPGRKLFDAIWPLLLVLLMDIGWLVLLYMSYQSHWLKPVFIGLQFLVLAVIWRNLQTRMPPEGMRELEKRFPFFRIKPIWFVIFAVGIVLVSVVVGYMTVT